MGQRNYNPLHEKINCDAVENTRQYCLIDEEADTAAGEIKNSGGTKRYGKVQNEAQERC